MKMKKRQTGRTISSTQRYGDDLPEMIIELDKATGLILDKGDIQTAILAEVKRKSLVSHRPKSKSNFQVGKADLSQRR